MLLRNLMPQNGYNITANLIRMGKYWALDMSIEKFPNKSKKFELIGHSVWTKEPVKKYSV